MAYLHCHSCDWSQDDFWSWRYNPVTKFWNDVKWLWWPRMIELDEWLIDDLVEYTGVPQYRQKTSSGKNVRVFTWNWLLLEFVKELKIGWEQKWWTWNSWQKTRETAVCPKCGDRNFDID